MEKSKVDKIMDQLSEKLEERKVVDRRKASNAELFDKTKDRRSQSDRREKNKD